MTFDRHAETLNMEDIYVNIVWFANGDLNLLLCASPWTLNLYTGHDWFLVFVSLPAVLCSMLFRGFFL